MRKRSWPWLLVLLLVGGLAWHASRSVPLGPAEGTTLSGEVAQHAGIASAVAGRKTFRVATFNIHGCTGADGRRDVNRVAGCLAGFDFVVLNEVHGPWLWPGADQAEQLGRRLRLAWLFAPDTRSWYHFEFGNGLLTAMPAAFWQRIPLEHRHDRGYRNAVLVAVRHEGRTVRVLLTHVTRHDEDSRQRQLRAVIDLYLSLAAPAILMGDLNTVAGDAQLRRLLAEPGVEDPVAKIRGAKTPPRIDWIFTRGLRVRNAGVREGPASDHPLVWAEVELE
jgi:endonuclease/exonuclease/phosphatase family metal-dependent hydrolase